MGKVDILHRYTTAIREAYPKLAIEQTALNRDGIHNDVVIVNGNFVCRFPKTDVAKNNLEQEVALHRFLRDKISLTIPQLERVQAILSATRLSRACRFLAISSWDWMNAPDRACWHSWANFTNRYMA